MHDGPQCSLGDCWSAGHLRHRQDRLLDLRGQSKQTQNLGDTCACDSLPAGDVGLIPDLAGVELPSPLDRLAEELGNPGYLGISGRFGVASHLKDRAHRPVARHTARQGAHIAVFKRPLGAKGYFDGLFAIGGNGDATLDILGYMYNPEVNLRLDRPGAGSNTVTYGEPDVPVYEPRPGSVTRTRFRSCACRI